MPGKCQPICDCRYVSAVERFGSYVIARRWTEGRKRQRRAMVLIAAMVIIFALVSMVIVLGQAMQVELSASANERSAAQARMVARSAEQYVLAMLSESTDPIESLPEADFAAVPVGSGYFWLVRPDYDDPGLPAFGLVDESSKLDINLAPLDVLKKLEGMTDELADSIVDWRDEDDSITGQGAESESYLSRRDPYRAKNSPFESVEELLMVKGMDRQLLFGVEADGAGSTLTGQSQTFAPQWYQAHGVYDLLTVWGRAAQQSSEGTDRLNPNNQQMRNEFAAMLRQQLGQSRGDEVAGLLGRGDLRNVLDFAIRTRLSAAELRTLEPYIRVEPLTQGQNDPAALPPLRVNINSAPRQVLMTLAGLSEADADTLLARRPVQGTTLSTTDAGSIAWVLDAFGDPQRVSQKLIDLGDQITGQGAIWSADIVAVSGDGRAFERVRLVVARETSPPRILFRRDMTERGWPLDQAILDNLRAGSAVASSARLN
ncbi:MAG: general secretion pathway protein GspK [Phycisphaerales bacterium]|nr:general secretion pathway protein GspK [Phycisphaerales bacterium]